MPKINIYQNTISRQLRFIFEYSFVNNRFLFHVLSVLNLYPCAMTLCFRTKRVTFPGIGAVFALETSFIVPKLRFGFASYNMFLYFVI